MSTLGTGSGCLRITRYSGWIHRRLPVLLSQPGTSRDLSQLQLKHALLLTSMLDQLHTATVFSVVSPNWLHSSVNVRGRNKGHFHIRISHIIFLLGIVQIKDSRV